MRVWKLREKRVDGWYRVDPLILKKRQDYTGIPKSVYHQLKNKNHKDQGFCHRKFKANILFDSLEVYKSKIKEGDYLVSSNGLLKVKKRGKGCYPECPIFDGKPCNFITDVFFMEAITEGYLSIKDELFFV